MRRGFGREMVVVDPGARASRSRRARHALVERAAERVSESRRRLAGYDLARPCQLGRGLGIYDAPRGVVLHARVLD
jgi:hypothetical protein